MEQPQLRGTGLQVLYGADRARSHDLALQKLEHSEVMTALQASAVQDGALHTISLIDRMNLISITVLDLPAEFQPLDFLVSISEE